MPRFAHSWRPGILAALLLGTGVFLGLAGWPQPDRTREFAGAILAAILTATLARRSPAAEDRGLMPTFFVVDFSVLLLLGGYAALLVAAAGILMRWSTNRAGAYPIRSTLLNAGTITMATGTASLAYGALVGASGPFAWPWQGIPVAAAASAYLAVQIISTEVVAPLLSTGTFHRSWPAAVVRNGPAYFIGASL